MTTADCLDEPLVLLSHPPADAAAAATRPTPAARWARALAQRLVHAAAAPFRCARGWARCRSDAHARADERDYARCLIATYGKLD